MTDVTFAFQIDIGWSPSRGYGAVIKDVQNQRQKGVKGNSIRQLMRNVSEQIAIEDQKRRAFPLEHEPSRIITPDNFG